MKKICFFTQNLAEYISGGRWYPWHIIHCLAKAGNKVTVYSETKPMFDREYERFPGRENIKFYYDNFYAMKDTKNHAPIKECDLVISSPILSTDYAMAYAKGIYKKRVATLVYEPINLVDDAISNGVQIPFVYDQKWSDFTKQVVKTDMIICNNRYCMDHSMKWLPNYRGQFKYLYNGINTFAADKIKIKSVEQRENAICYLSRMVQYKGFGELLYVFAQTKTKPKIYLITGFYDKFDKLTQKFIADCKNYNIELDLKIKCTDEEKFEILSRCKALFFSSHFEGFGLPPAEAFYMKTPVVCYNLPVLTEFYKDFPHYLEYRDANSAIPLFDELLSNNELLFRNIDAARDHVKQHCEVDNFTEHLLQVLGFGESKVEIKTDKKDLVSIVKFGDKGDLEESLKFQSFKEFKLHPNKNISEINTEYMVIADSRCKLSNRFLESAMISIQSTDIDFVYGSCKLDDKEVFAPDYCLEAVITDPSCICGVIFGKTKSFLKILENIDFKWSVNLLINGRNMNWKNLNKITFSGDSRIKLEICGEDIFELTKKELNRISDIYDLERYNKMNNFKTKEIFKDKVLGIILARTNKFLPRFLESLKTSTYKDIDFVIVHHNPEGNWNKSVLKTATDYEIGVIKVDGPFNYCKFNNIAFDKYIEEKHKYIILFNDDLVIHKDSINNMISTFKYKEKIGVVGSKLLFPSGDQYKFPSDINDTSVKYEIEHAGVVLLKDYGCTHIYKHYPHNYFLTNFIRKQDSCTFAFIGIDKDCYKSLKLDEEIPVEFNDIDFCLRAKAVGWNIVYNPYALAFHLEAATRKELKLSNMKKDKEIFLERHKAIFNTKPMYKDLKNVETYGSAGCVR